ncbi:hypothetical protein [Sulfitobacter sp. EhC04]|uniref:hypothetical protein n=1 Tax=Sulfitobacter sp. EhC04 TaxID=1849168 RepID=UPI0010FE4F2B|nr:hypothetical protein [Sulfitobacter sp. EhC04]
MPQYANNPALLADAPGASFDIDIRYNQTLDSVVVSRGGEALAILQGMHEADIPDIDIIGPPQATIATQA